MDCETREIADSAVLKNVDIKAKKVVIGEGARLENVRVESASFFVGKDTRINDSILLSNGSIEIGKLVQIKEDTVLKAFRGVKIGDRTIIDRGVVIAGLQSEHSYFEVGSRCVILHHTYINTAREVLIGNSVGVGGYCLIFTHGVWQNAFKGYPFQFGKVEIKDDVWLPWHVFVMPGVTIGRGTTIAGGSVVTKDIPEYCLAGGVPAKVIRGENYPAELSKSDKNNLAKSILHDFVSYVKGFVCDASIGLKEMGDDMIVLTSDMGNLVYSKEMTDQLDNTDLSLLKDFDIVSFQVPLPLKETHNWIEIDSETRSKNVNKLSNEFAQFISRYGVRLIDNR
jgi:acetyltransferase-like isoleucine patch superfamily enzyme